VKIVRKYETKTLDSDINFTPLIDIVFLLLLFFMLASTLDNDITKATIQLPQSGAQISKTKDSPLTLYLDKNGIISIDKEVVPWDILHEYLKEKNNGFSSGINVYADKEVAFDYIARIIVIGNLLKMDKIDFLLEYQSFNAELTHLE